MVMLIADGSFCVALNSPHSGTSMPSGAVHPISVGSLCDGSRPYFVGAFEGASLTP